MEKEAYATEAPPYDDPSRIIEDKGIKIGEASEVYGDIQTAEDFGYVNRGYVAQLPVPCSNIVLNKASTNFC